MRFEWDEAKNRQNLANTASALRPRRLFLTILMLGASKSVSLMAKSDGKPLEPLEPWLYWWPTRGGKKTAKK